MEDLNIIAMKKGPHQYHLLWIDEKAVDAKQAIARWAADEGTNLNWRDARRMVDQVNVRSELHGHSDK